MINQAINKIIKEFSLKYSDGIIKQSLYSALDQKDFDIIKQQFNLSESRLKYIDCPSCDNQCQIKIKPGRIKFVHCLADGCGILKDLQNNEDLAYQITINGVADFLIKLLGIEGEKRVIEAGESIYLGKKELQNLGNLAFDIYLLRNSRGKETLLKYYHPTSKKISTIIIKLDNKSLDIELKQVANCCFSDLVTYDNNFGRFDINYKTFLGAIKGCFADSLQTSGIQKWLNEKFTDYFKELIKNKKIKDKEKAKYQTNANQYFNVSPNKFREIWQEYASKNLKKGGRPSDKSVKK